MSFISKLGEILSPLAGGNPVDEAKKTVQRKTDAYIDKKQEAFVSKARSEAEQFMSEQMVLLEAKVDTKILEIEKIIDEQIEKEVRNKLRVLIYTLITVVLMSVISLLYLFLKQKFGL